MKNASVNDFVPIQRVLLYYKSLFGKETTLDQVLIFADHILRETGTIGRKKLFMRAIIKNRKIGLPCGTFAVDSVNYSKPFQWDSRDQSDIVNESILVNYIVPHPMYNGYSLDINAVETSKPMILPLDQMPVNSPVGNYIDYEHNGDHLKFNEENVSVDIIVRIIQVDKDGYPFMTDKSAMAFAYWLNFVATQRLYFSKMADNSMLQIADELYRVSAAKARTPEAIGKNEMDDIMNVLTSMNRKFYDLPYGR